MGPREIDRSAYDAIKAANWSTIKVLARSPAHYRHNLAAGRKDTPRLKTGRAAHAAVFEPDIFAAEFPVWDGGARRGKLWEAFSAEHLGEDILTEDEAGWCMDIASTVRSHPVAGAYVRGGRSEITVQWDHVVPSVSDLPELRIPCKARLDYVTATALVDLKTTRTASPSGFGREVANYFHHAQAAMYVDGYEAATGKRLPFVLIAVEAEAPHVVQVYTVPDRILDLGREHYRVLLQQLEWCRRENTWPGYSDDVLELELPRWADPEPVDDLTDVGLTFGEEEAA